MKSNALLFVFVVLSCVFLTGCLDGGMPLAPPPYYNVNYYLNETNETLKLYVKNNTNLGYTIYGNEGFFDYLQANNFTGGLISTDYGYFQIVDIYNGSMDVAYIGTATIDNANINNAVIGNLSGDSLSFITIRTDNLYVNESIYGTNITVDAVYAGDLYGYIDAGYITGESWLDSGDQRYNETALIISVNNSLTSTIVEINDTLNSRIDNITLYGPWVLKAGDTMTGNLNMSNNNITDVDTLYVHNISGRSPINILSDVISNNSITADMFYGNINGQNGTIYGVSIVNGSIVNLHVTESAWVDSNMSVNGTFRAREYGSMSPIVFVDENGTKIAQISTKGTFEENITYGYIRAQEIIVDRLSIIGLLNYSPSEPPDYYFSDEVWINKIANENNTQFTFNFNESTLNLTLIDFALNLNSTINQSFSNLSASIDYLFILISDEVQARINNDTALDLRINVTNGRIDAINLSMANYYTKNETDLLLDNKLNVTDQRYNDTLLILEVNNSLNLTNANLAQEILDRIAGGQALNGSIISVNDTMYILINNTNIALQNEITGRINNDSYLQGQIDAINGSVLFASGDQTLNGNLIITGNFSVIGSFVNLNVIQQTVNGSIYPGVSGLFDIGSPSLVWNNIYSTLFVGQMDASNITNAPWLLMTDQRYNETALIVALNQTKLDITDQRYNDTGYIDALILIINQSKLDISDQRYNDTEYINGLITILNQTKLDISDQRYNDTAVIEEVNQTLTQAIIDLYSFLDNYYNITEINLLFDNKLNVSDQRYNDTLLINEVNSTLNALLDAETLGRIGNDTNLQNQINAINLSQYYNITETDYLLSLKLNETDQLYNDTALILVINNSLNYTNAVLAQEILDRIAGDLALNGSIISVNSTLLLLIQGVNSTLQQEIIDRVNNDSYLDNRITIVNNSVLHNTGDQTLNGNLLINGNLSVIGSFVNLNVVQQTVNGSIYPGLDGIFDLGSTSLVWNTVYANLFVGSIDASNITNSPWLLMSDQRYNETALFVSLDNSKLNITDQRYNDTGLILFINSTKLDITDQRYNDTNYIDSLIYIINMSKLDITDQRYNETGLIYNLINALNASKLDITDQRYNETNYIDGLILAINLSKLDITDQRYNETAGIVALNETKLEFVDNIYLYKENVTVYLNESKLNFTINNISEVVSYTTVVQVNVSGGVGTAITDAIEYEITQIIVMPTTSTNSYKFAAYEYPSGNIIDKDLKAHVGTWNIMKSYALDSQVQLNITNANIDEPFFVTIKYLNNGLQ